MGALASVVFSDRGNHRPCRFHFRQRISGADAGGFGDLQGVFLIGFGRERKSAPAFVLGAEIGHGFAGRIHDFAREVRRLFGGGESGEIHAVRQTGDEFAAFGVHRQIDGLQQNGNRLRGGFHHAAVFDGKGQRAFAAGDFLGQTQTGRNTAPRHRRRICPWNTCWPSTRACTVTLAPVGKPPSARSTFKLAATLSPGP